MHLHHSTGQCTTDPCCCHEPHLHFQLSKSSHSFCMPVPPNTFGNNHIPQNMKDSSAPQKSRNSRRKAFPKCVSPSATMLSAMAKAHRGSETICVYKDASTAEAYRRTGRVAFTTCHAARHAQRAAGTHIHHAQPAHYICVTRSLPHLSRMSCTATIWLRTATQKTPKQAS